MPYIRSENVSVFPSTFRTKITSGKYTSEENFVNILNSLMDTNIRSDGSDGFIVSAETDLIVVIHGYLFRISDYRNVITQNNAFLSILVEDGDRNTASDSLVSTRDGSINLDSGNDFVGLEISESSPRDLPVIGGTTRYYLKVIENGKLCERNRVKFSSTSVSYDSSSSVKTKFDQIDDTIGNSDTGLQAQIDNLKATKQNNLVVDSPETSYLSLNKDQSKLSLSPNGISRLNSLSSKGQGGVKLVYFNANGEAINSTSNIGRVYEEVNFGNIVARATTPVYLRDGAITTGNTTFLSTSSPPESGNFSDGDIWFKYQG